MAEHLSKCLFCGRYTLEKSCPSCRQQTVLSRPPKFSPEDKYGELRRKVKKRLLEEQGLY